ncbi:MAG: hypothetical protein LAN37_04735 [Acidobacteriia bacterium]|nr:hypothetical protein [Terriglobia bacterium]
MPPSIRPNRRALLALATLLLLAAAAAAQDNYEVQVYGSDTVPSGATMVELHSNFTAAGRKNITDGLLPTDHALHETLEITHGFTPWFETGFYVFTAARSGYGWQWVGDHIRPRVAVPVSWKWPVGVSLSTEIGYQRRDFSPDTWTVELRPIVDKKLGRWYLSFNPTVDKSLHGENAGLGWEFSPNAKVSFDVVPKVSVGLEYYGALGPIGNLDPVAQQEQQIVPAIDLNLSPKWEVNIGVGIGVTRSTDHLLVKFILGRRFENFPPFWTSRKPRGTAPGANDPPVSQER